MNLREFIQSEIKSQLYLSEASGTLKIEKRKDGKYYWKFTFKSGKVEDSYSGFDSGADAKRDFMYRSKYLSEGVDWKSFYTMAKDTSGYNPSFEKKYGKLLDSPHIKDALDKTKDFNSFMKFIKKFETVNEGVKLSLVDPNTNKFIKTLSLDRTYREAEKEVETLNKRLSTSQKNKGLYWKVTSIGESVNEGIWPKS